MNLYYLKIPTLFISLLLFLFINFTNKLQAQDEKKIKRGKDGEIENTEVIIEKNRKLELPEAERNFEKIPSQLKKIEPQPQKYDKLVEPVYQLPDVNTKFQLLPPPTEIKNEIKGNYLKAGFEPIYSGSYLEAFLNNNRNANHNFGLHARHLGFANGPFEKRNSASGDQSLKGFYSFYKKQLIFNSSLQYERKQLYFYGYEPSKEVDRDSIKQIFNNIQFKADLNNRSSDSTIGYKLGFGIKNIHDAYKAKEFEIAVKAGGDYLISKNIIALVNTELFFTTLSSSFGSINRNLIRLKPSIKYTAGLLNFELGLNIVNQNDTAKSLTKINVYPIAKIDAGLSERFSLFAVVAGDVQRNTLQSFVFENPWIAPETAIQNSNRLIDISAGFKAGIGNNFSFKLAGSYEKYKNYYFFINSFSNQSKFISVYEPLDTKLLKLSGQLNYDQNKIRMGLNGELLNYTLTSISAPYHRPTFTGNFFAKYNFDKNLHFNIEFYYISGIKSLNTNLEQVILGPIADLNLKSEYFLKDNFSVYASLNNIFSNNYQRYQYYSNRGIQAMLGFTLAF